MKKSNISITELLSGLDSAQIAGIDPAPAQDAPEVSSQRVLELAKQKRGCPTGVSHIANEQSGHTKSAGINGVRARKQSGGVLPIQRGTTAGTRGNGIRMNRKRTWTIFIAAAVLLLSVGALAAGVLGGAEFFRSIFGETAEAVEPYISDPRLVAENDTHSLVVESLLTDGYQLRMIVSITGDMGESPLTASENRAGGDLRGSYIAGDVVADPWIALTDSSAGIDGYQVYEHAEFSTDTKRYYSIAAQSVGGFGPTLTVASKTLGLSVEVTPSEALGTLSVAPAAADYASANFHPTMVRVSPMGVLVIGTEKVQQGGLPAPEVRLQYKGGKSELVIDQTYFDQTGDGTSMGGGGIILSGSGKRPLCEEVHGMRNPDLEVVLSGQFTRILNLNEVEAILVDGVAYTVE